MLLLIGEEVGEECILNEEGLRMKQLAPNSLKNLEVTVTRSGITV